MDQIPDLLHRLIIFGKLTNLSTSIDPEQKQTHRNGILTFRFAPMFY